VAPNPSGRSTVPVQKKIRIMGELRELLNEKRLPIEKMRK